MSPNRQSPSPLIPSDAFPQTYFIIQEDCYVDVSYQVLPKDASIFNIQSLSQRYVYASLEKINLLVQKLSLKTMILKNGSSLPPTKHVLSLSHCKSGGNQAKHLREYQGPGPEVIKLFSCSTELSMKFFLLINDKMPTILGLSEPKKLNFLIFLHL